jgi:hypothetical protein
LRLLEQALADEAGHLFAQGFGVALNGLAHGLPAFGAHALLLELLEQGFERLLHLLRRQPHAAQHALGHPALELTVAAHAGVDAGLTGILFQLLSAWALTLRQHVHQLAKLLAQLFDRLLELGLLLGV